MVNHFTDFTDELRGVPREQRRCALKRAWRASLKHPKTWAGLGLYGVSCYLGANFERGMPDFVLGSMAILGVYIGMRLQYSAVRDILRKNAHPQGVVFLAAALVLALTLSGCSTGPARTEQFPERPIGSPAEPSLSGPLYEELQIVGLTNTIPPPPEIRAEFSMKKDRQGTVIEINAPFKVVNPYFTNWLGKPFMFATNIHDLRMTLYGVKQTPNIVIQINEQEGARTEVNALRQWGSPKIER